MKKFKWYVGISITTGHPIMFSASIEASDIRQAKYPQYSKVVGPFRNDVDASHYQQAYLLKHKLKENKNPGAKWHFYKAVAATEKAQKAKKPKAKAFHLGERFAHKESALISKMLHQNPRSSLTKIYDNVLAIEAQKGKDSLWPKELFKHKFKSGSHIYGLEDGSILIKSSKGKRLWKNIDY